MPSITERELRGQFGPRRLTPPVASATPILRQLAADRVGAHRFEQAAGNVRERLDYLVAAARTFPDRLLDLTDKSYAIVEAVLALTGHEIARKPFPWKSPRPAAAVDTDLLRADPGAAMRSALAIFELAVATCTDARQATRFMRELTEIEREIARVNNSAGQKAEALDR